MEPTCAKRNTQESRANVWTTQDIRKGASVCKARCKTKEDADKGMVTMQWASENSSVQPLVCKYKAFCTFASKHFCYSKNTG
eukprot:scaffold109472_cov19-Tisochrysis_lutea.AAC.2